MQKQECSFFMTLFTVTAPLYGIPLRQGARPSLEPQKSNLRQAGAYTVATPH